MTLQKEQALKLILEGKKSQEVRRKLIERTPRSAAVKGGKLAAEIVQTVDLPHPIYTDSVQGGTLTDVDGNTYLDTTMGFGPIVLGHRPPAVVEALEKQTEKGWLFGIPTPLQVELGDLVQQASPSSDSVIFCNTGSEATMYAMRAARAFSGKPKIATFEGCYHGAHDYALIFADPRSPHEDPYGMAVGQGIPDAIREHTMRSLPYRSEIAFDLIRKHKDELAAVLIEPVQNSNPRLGLDEWLQGLRDVCTETGVLLIFDEVVTGFRVAYGGVQEHYGITPDMTTYGKATGAGLPIGAVGGRSDIMDCFGAKSAKGIFAGGTFSGNPFSMAAGIAAVTTMRDTKDTLYPYLMEQGNRMAAEINGFCEQEGMPVQFLNAGSMFHMRFQKGEIRGGRDITDEGRWAEREFYVHLLGHGVIVPGVHLAFLCGAHTVDDVDTIIAAFKQSFLDIREDGLL